MTSSSMNPAVVQPGEDLMRKSCLRIWEELKTTMKIPCEGSGWNLKCKDCPAHHVSGECGIAIIRRAMMEMNFMQERRES